MALIIVSGFACSGRSTRCQELANFLQTQISAATSSSSTSSSIPTKISIISDASVHSSKSIYSNQLKEKPARASYLSAVMRSIDQNTITIADGGAGTNIKGFRYQLWCAARELRVRCLSIHVHAPPEKCKEWNIARRERGEESYDDDTIDWLLQRFEEPTDMARWDSPLFVLPYQEEKSNSSNSNGDGKLTLEALEKVNAAQIITKGKGKERETDDGRIRKDEVENDRNGKEEDEGMKDENGTPLKEDTKKAIQKLLDGEKNRREKKVVKSSFKKRVIGKKKPEPQGDEPKQDAFLSEGLEALKLQDNRRKDLEKEQDFPSPPASISPQSSPALSRRSNLSISSNPENPPSSQSTSSPFSEIWLLATSGQTKKAPTVVATNRSTSTNYLSTLESSSSKLISSLLSYQSDFGLPAYGGEVLIPVSDEDDKTWKIKIDLPNLGRKKLNLAGLTSLRRSFVRVNSTGGSAGGDFIGNIARIEEEEKIEGEEVEERNRNGKIKFSSKPKEEPLEIKVVRKFAFWLEQSL